jgi:hypothetical protein
MMINASEGMFRPAVGFKPSKIGIQQLLFSIGFVLIMIVAFLFG